MASRAGAPGRTRQRPYQSVLGMRRGEQLVDAVELRDRRQAGGKIVEAELASGLRGFAQPCEQHREQRRIELGDALQVDRARAFADRGIAVLENLRDVGERDRPVDQQPLSFAPDHRFFFISLAGGSADAGAPAAGAAATGLSTPAFFACSALISPSTPESRTMLANSVR